jgi:hypothetical protein
VTTVSVLGPQGVPRPPYAEFGLKVAGKDPGPFSVLGAQGVPRPPYGSFAGKVSKAPGPFSVLGPQGVPRPPYGPFNGKTQSPGILPGSSGGYRRRTGGITPEEWVILMAALQDE